MTYKSDLPVHVLVPDTQVKPGVPVDHLRWAGQYIVDKFKGHPACTIVHIGDHWDMPSLSTYDRGKGAMEGRRYSEDIAAGNAAFKALDAPIARCKGWKPRKVFLFGNHEERILRAANDNAQLDGTISLDDCVTPAGWERHAFLQPVLIDGIAYSHYFYNPMNGRPVAGMIETRLKTIGRSFTQGHQQTLMYGLRPMAGGMHHGLVAGSFYAHDETYLGPQGNDNWRGIVVKHQVLDGAYDPMMVSLDYLARRYGGYKDGLAGYRRDYGIRGAA